MIGLLVFGLLLGNFGQFHKNYHACKSENFASKSCEMAKKVCVKSKECK